MQTFLITRAENQADNLVSMIESDNHRALVLPVIKIADKELDPIENSLLNNFDRTTMIFFISANAVHQSMRHLDPYKNILNDTVKVVVIGPATEQALAKYGIKADIISKDGYNSEGLLLHPDLQNVSGSSILIFRGTGGRTVLTHELQRRGAIVDSIETYAREIPDENISKIQAYLDTGDLSAIVVMSSESLENLQQMTGRDRQEVLKSKQLVVISQRTAELANLMGFKRAAIISSSSDDLSVYNCLQNLT